jgi:hypothetical protein
VVLLLPKLYIIRFSNLSILCVPDEGYSRNVLCAPNIDTCIYVLLHVGEPLVSVYE